MAKVFEVGIILRGFKQPNHIFLYKESISTQKDAVKTVFCINFVWIPDHAKLLKKFISVCFSQASESHYQTTSFSLSLLRIRKNVQI